MVLTGLEFPQIIFIYWHILERIQTEEGNMLFNRLKQIDRSKMAFFVGAGISVTAPLSITTIYDPPFTTDIDPPG